MNTSTNVFTFPSRTLPMYEVFVAQITRITLLSLLIIALFALQAQPVKAEEPFKEANLEEIQKAVAKYKGEIVLLNIFASWCPPCVQEARTFAEFYKKYPPQKGVHLIGISLDDDKRELKKFISERNVKYPVYLAGQDFVDFYEVQTIPTLILFDKEGNVAEYAIGIASIDELTKFIDKYN